MAGEIVGSYRLVRKIGEGGMGAVYLAEHTLLGRPAAVKMLLRELSHREDLVARFFNEARAATAVKHPGIVEIYDFGYHSDGSAYIVMEFLDGESVATRLRRAGVLSELEAVALCRQIGGALAAAHARGIVHRDLKPDNIFIVRDADISGGQRAKVLDFGIAKLANDRPGEQAMTRTGMMMGTPAYMAPEQCKGAGNVDQRSDLYALGCILFEMVCGRPPFVAEGAGEIIAHHIFTPAPAPSSMAPVTPILEQVILRALAKDPGHRFGSADEMIAALHAVVPPAEPVRAAATDATVMAAGRSVGPVASAPGAAWYGPQVATQPRGYATPPPPVSQTTMSSAAGVATSAAVSVRRRRPWVAPIGALVVLAAAGGVFTVMRSGSDRSDRSTREAPIATPPAVAATPPGPPRPPEATPQAPPPPMRATLTISSNPPGAEVYRMPQSVRIGTTPLRYPIDATPGEVVLIVKKPGYRDETIAMAADRDAAQTVTLVRKPVAGTPRPDGAKPPGGDDFLTKTPGPPPGSLDPSAKPKK